MILKKINVDAETLIGGGIAIGAFVIYLMTLCPTVNFIDSGELATVACTLGIAHPTGYPLFSLISWLWIHIPLGLRPIVQLNVLAAVLCSTSLFIFFRLIVFCLRTINNNQARSNKIEKKDFISPLVINGAAAYATITLAFSETYWSQALSIEVYSLHILFLGVLLLLFMKANQITIRHLDGQRQRHESLIWYFFAVVLGLAFTNHMTTILLAPAFLYLYFAVHGVGIYAWKKIARLIIPFLIGFSVYLYLPVRASQHPIINWGNPVDLEKFLWHFSGKVYRVWIFSSMESAGKQLIYFIQTLGSEFAYLPLVVAGLGLRYFFTYSRRMFYFTVLLFLGCLLYSINYDIHDIDAYFLLVYFTVAIWTGGGVCQIIRWVRSQKRIRIVLTLLIISCLFGVSWQYSGLNQRKNTVVEDYTRAMLKYIEPNGVVISYQWDYFVSASYYFQIVENVRPDVVVIDKELLRRSWYYEQLKNRYPGFLDHSRHEIELFLKELFKFEHDQPYNAQLIEYRYAEVIKSIVEKNYATRPIYVTPEIEERYTSPFQRVPSGLAFRLYVDKGHAQIVTPDFVYRDPGFRDKYTEGVLSLYVGAYLNHAMYDHALGFDADAKVLIEKAAQLRPEARDVKYVKEKIGGGK
jgi:hypothetical protein